MKQKFSFSLRGVMVASVLTLTCASLAMIISSARQEFNDNIEQTRNFTTKLAADMASEFKLLVNAAQEQGKTLSLLPDVQNRNAPGVEPLLADFLAGNPVYANILLLDQDGRRSWPPVPFRPGNTRWGRRAASRS